MAEKMENNLVNRRSYPNTKAHLGSHSLFISIITVSMVPIGIDDSGRMSRIRCQPAFVDSTPISVVRTTYLLQVELC